MSDPLTRARASLASIGGSALANTTRLVSGVRQAAKPLHPHGEVMLARLERIGARPETGVPWLDQEGEDDALVRESRAVGLPGVVPDIYGLAMRVPLPGGAYGDLLFASTGLGRLSRFVLTPSWSTYGRPMTTLLPYRTDRGPLLLAATAAGDPTLELACASPTGAWRTFGYLHLSGTPGPDPTISFDPLLNPVPGLQNYPWVQRLREPSYRTARETR